MVFLQVSPSVLECLFHKNICLLKKSKLHILKNIFKHNNVYSINTNLDFCVTKRIYYFQVFLAGRAHERIQNLSRNA